jgi:hypothetical protein
MAFAFPFAPPPGAIPGWQLADLLNACLRSMLRPSREAIVPSLLMESDLPVDPRGTSVGAVAVKCKIARLARREDN